MSENYIGTKFETIFRDQRTPEYSDSISGLRKWCRRLANFDSTPRNDYGFPGNGSYRTEGGFVITAAEANLAILSEDDFVEVEYVDIEKERVFVKGFKKPSSESFIHNAIYHQRPQVNVIFHGHSDLLLANYRTLRLPSTKTEQPYGTIALMLEVLEALGDNNILIIKNHGFITLGGTIDEVGLLIIDYYHRAQKLNQVVRK